MCFLFLVYVCRCRTNKDALSGTELEATSTINVSTHASVVKDITEDVPVALVTPPEDVPVALVTPPEDVPVTLVTPPEDVPVALVTPEDGPVALVTPPENVPGKSSETTQRNLRKRKLPPIIESDPDSNDDSSYSPSLSDNEPERCVLCDEEVYLACGHCFVFLCFNHQVSDCKIHNPFLTTTKESTDVGLSKKTNLNESSFEVEGAPPEFSVEKHIINLKKSNKLLRNCGESYIGGTKKVLKPKQNIYKPPCEYSNPSTDCEVFSEVERECIRNSYYKWEI